MSLKDNLINRSLRMRRMALTSIFEAKSGHPGGVLSAIDLVNFILCENLKKEKNSRFILSKGHAAPALYTADLKPRFNHPVVQRYMFPTPGKIKSVQLPGWLSSDPEVSFFELRVDEGDIVQPALNHPARAGVVITTGSNVPNAISKAESVISSVKIITEQL